MEWGLCVQILTAQHNRVEMDHVWPILSSHLCDWIEYHNETIIVTTSATNPRRTNSKTRASIFEFDCRDWRDQMHEVLKSMLSSENAILYLYLVGGRTHYCTSSIHNDQGGEGTIPFTSHNLTFWRLCEKSGRTCSGDTSETSNVSLNNHTRVRYGPCHMARVLWQ